VFVTGQVTDYTRLFDAAMRPLKRQMSGAKVGLAVSGGGDSMALLHLARAWAAENNCELFVATVNHGLRSEAHAETEMVQRACKRMGIKCTTLTWSGWDKAGNLQDAARRARIDLINAWAQNIGLNAVATGHTADDQAETFLLRLARGSGVDGLSGMATLRERDGMIWFRPLLTFRRAELRRFLKSKRVKWVDDPSNDDDSYDRIKMRKAQSALDALGLTIDRLVETTTRMSTARRALERITKSHAHEVTTPTRFGTVKIDIEAFNQLPLELRYRLFAHALKWVSGSIYRPRFDALLESAAKLSNAQDHTLLGCHVLTDGKTGEVCREVAKIKPANNFKAPFDGRWSLATSQETNGLSIAALGEEGLPQCKDWRELGMSRVSLLGTPAIWRNGALISAPMVMSDANWKCRLGKDHHDFFTSLVTH
jgi:tRNA(Ile)-lysidine synthase